MKTVKLTDVTNYTPAKILNEEGFVNYQPQYK